MVQIDVPMAACSTLMLVDAAHRQLQLKNDPEQRYFYKTLAKVNLFTAFFFVWIPVYFVIDYFPWETTYLYNYQAMSEFMRAAFVPLLILAVFAVANMAFWLGWRWVRNGYLRRVRILYALLWLYAATWIVAFFPRTATVTPRGTQFQSVSAGSFTEYKQLRDESGRPLAFYILPLGHGRFDVDQVHHTDAEREDPFLGILIFTLVWWGVPQILMIRHLLREGRRVDRVRAVMPEAERAFTTGGTDVVPA
jgi:hypothetical protein